MFSLEQIHDVGPYFIGHADFFFLFLSFFLCLFFFFFDMLNLILTTILYDEDEKLQTNLFREISSWRPVLLHIIDLLYWLQNFHEPHGLVNLPRN